jgi:hypothetical protein
MQQARREEFGGLSWVGAVIAIVLALMAGGPLVHAGVPTSARPSAPLTAAPGPR